MDTTTPTITSETARHVLWMCGAKGGRQPDRAIMRILAAWDVAEGPILAGLERGFPELAAARAAADYDPDGIANLQRIAGIDPAEPTVPQCPEALFDRDTGELRRCTRTDQHEDHKAADGTQWRLPAMPEIEVPF